MASASIACRVPAAVALSLGVLCCGATGVSAAGAGTAGDPFTALAEAHSVPSGRHHFDTGGGAFEADVDGAQGGGRVPVLQYGHASGTNPPLSILGAGADLPVTSTAPLGTDESADPARWGHAGNAATSGFPGDIELRRYGRASGHGRTIHFRSSLGDDCVRTGSGDFDGLATSFTPLSGYDAFLPATANRYFAGRGDEAMTNFPFYQGSTRHWGVQGLNSRWEVDVTPPTSGRTTTASGALPPPTRPASRATSIRGVIVDGIAATASIRTASWVST